MKRSAQAILLAAGLVTAGGAAFMLWPARQGSPKAIMGLARSGATEQELMNEVKRSSKNYTLSPDDVINLSAAKVPDSVIVVMLEKQP